jgi:pimeloyl-ACP methyl ester carboxylesterase
MDASRLSFTHALPWTPRAALSVAAAAALSRLRRHTLGMAEMPIAPARELCVAPFGRVVYYTNATELEARASEQEQEYPNAPPLLLLHGMHMRADAHELALLLDAFRAGRHVYVPDLPGFGASQPGESPCHPELYVDCVKQLIELCAGDALAPVDVVAVGLTCEHAARAVASLPDMVRSFAMIGPTGFASEREESVLERIARRGGTFLPLSVLERLGLARVCSAGFAAVLSGAAFSRDNPQAAYTRVHCPSLVLHERARRARYGTLARFVRWREHYQQVELTSLNLSDRVASAQVASSLALFFEPSTQQQADAPKLRAG